MFAPTRRVVKNVKMKSLRHLGFTLIELVVAMAIASIMVMAVAQLLSNGQRIWNNVYNATYKQLQEDSQAVLISFGTWGRKANRQNYQVYEASGDKYIPALPQTTEPVEVVEGDAVEFRYWNTPQPVASLMDVNITATDYSLYYLEDEQLKVDFGPYPPAGIDGGGSRRTGLDIKTEILAENVTDLKFSHTTTNGVGQGSVRIQMTLTDPETGDTRTVMTSTRLRNGWPR